MKEICTHCHQPITKTYSHENEVGEDEIKEEGHLGCCCRNWTVDCPHKENENIRI